MKHISSIFVLSAAVITLIGCESYGRSLKTQDRVDARPPYDNLMKEFPPTVSVEPLPATRYDYIDMSGSYSQHDKAIDKLMPIATEMRAHAVIAVYPDDPDLVQEADLTWQIGIEMAPGKEGRSGLSSREIGDTLVAKLDSTVLDTPGDGKMLLAWIDLNGYVQIQPTMMRFSLSALERHPDNPAVQIVIPVAKRTHF